MAAAARQKVREETQLIVAPQDHVIWSKEPSFDFEPVLIARDYKYMHTLKETPRGMQLNWGARLPQNVRRTILEGKGFKCDARAGTVVCEHWLRGLCMKGESCEFLHRFELERMAECKYGESCEQKDCCKRHVKLEERPECFSYKQGFCRSGPLCKYRHLKLAAEELPDVANLTAPTQTQGLSAGLGSVKPGGPENNPALNPYFKVTLCRHFMQDNSCTYGDRCHFAHGNADKRDHPDAAARKSAAARVAEERRAPPSAPAPPAGPPPPSMLSPAELAAAEAEHSIASAPPHTAQYFVLCPDDFPALEACVASRSVDVHRANAARLRSALSAAEHVVLLFSVRDSGHFQGCARVESVAEDDASAPMSARITLAWQRRCVLPFAKVYHLRIEAEQGAKDAKEGRSVIQSNDFERLTVDIGRRLTVAVHVAPLVAEGAAWTPTPIGTTPQQITMLLKETRPHRNADPMARGAWIVRQPGFVFSCTNETMNACFERVVFALGLEDANASEAVSTDALESVAKLIVRPRTPLFLLNVDTQCIYGVFNPASKIGHNLVPGAFAEGGGGGEEEGGDGDAAAAAAAAAVEAAASRFPVQLKVRAAPGAADCPALLQNFVQEALLAATRRDVSAVADTTGFAALRDALPAELMRAMEARREALGITGGVSTGPLSIDESQALVDALIRARNITASAQGRQPPMLPKPPLDESSDAFAIEMPLGLAAGSSSAASSAAAAAEGEKEGGEKKTPTNAGATGIDALAVLEELARVAETLRPRSLRSVVRSTSASVRLLGEGAELAFGLLGQSSELVWLDEIEEVAGQPLQLVLSVKRPPPPTPPQLQPPPPDATPDAARAHHMAMQQKQFAFHLEGAQYNTLLVRCVEDYHELKSALVDVMALVHCKFPPLLKGVRDIVRHRAEAARQKIQREQERKMGGGGGDTRSRSVEKRRSRERSGGRGSKSRDGGGGRKRSREEEPERKRSGEKRSRDGASGGGGSRRERHRSRSRDRDRGRRRRSRSRDRDRRGGDRDRDRDRHRGGGGRRR